MEAFCFASRRISQITAFPELQNPSLPIGSLSNSLARKVYSKKDSIGSAGGGNAVRNIIKKVFGEMD